MDRETTELAARLATHLKGMRSTSLFALETFLEAVERDDVLAAQLTLEHERGGRLEAELRVGSDLNER